MLLQITAPHFCAGIDDGEPAPIIHYMRGWSIDRISAYCNNKKWTITKAMTKGVISKHTDKSFQGKTLYSFLLSGDDNYYNTGEKKPPAVGSYVEFDFTVSPKGYKNVKKINILDQSTAPVQSSKSALTNVNLSKDDYWNRKEDRDIETQRVIQLQSSRNSAISLVSAMLTAGAIKLPENVAKREEIISNVVLKYIEEFQKANDEARKTPSNAKPEVAETDRSESSESKNGAAEDDGLWDN